jgi:hypothetical protein
MVTRWVRPDSVAGTGKSIPAVGQTSGAKVLRDTVKARCIEVIDGNDYEDTNLKPKGVLFRHLKTLSEDTLTQYLTAMDELPDKYPADLLLGVLQNEDDDQAAQYVLAIAKMDRQIDPEWSDYSGGPYHYVSANKMFKGLSMYEWSGYTPPEDINDDSNPAVAQTKALITVVLRAWENGDIADEYDDTMCLGDGNLVSLILEHPEDAEEIAETIRATGTTDGRRIREMLETASKSMRSGVL